MLLLIVVDRVSINNKPIMIEQTANSFRSDEVSINILGKKRNLNLFLSVAQNRKRLLKLNCISLFYELLIERQDAYSDYRKSTEGLRILRINQS